MDVIGQARLAVDLSGETILRVEKLRMGPKSAGRARHQIQQALKVAVEGERHVLKLFGLDLPAHVGPICTVDAFYNPDPDYFARWSARGVLAFEMESSVLFYLAARAAAGGADVRAATICTVSDVLGEGTSHGTFLPPDELERRISVMLDVALAAVSTPI